MCTPSNQQIIETIIDEFVMTRKQFTAWDVTQEARKRGATEFHGQMKGSVHGLWNVLQDENYSRQAIALPGVSPDPWLYFPHESDPQDYVDEVISQLGGTANVAAATNNVAAATNNVDGVDISAVDSDEEDDADASPFDLSAAADKKNGQPTTKSGRLTIPKHGFLPGAKVFVYVKTGEKISIQPHLPPPSSGFNHITSYRINTDGRLRLSPKVLQAANLRTNLYEIEHKQAEIVVTAAK